LPLSDKFDVNRKSLVTKLFYRSKLLLATRRSRKIASWGLLLQRANACYRVIDKRNPAESISSEQRKVRIRSGSKGPSKRDER